MSPDDDGDLPYMVDRFVIEDELGAGGMGRVFLAYDPSLDRRVAVKLVRDRPGTDRAASHARIASEARAMAKLRHPNVVTVHEVGAHGGDLFIVMEYVAGGTLRDWLARMPDARWQQIVAMYALAGRGLAAAHDAGLVHRDFKPDNVLVGDDGRVLVTDFGIAHVAGAADGAAVGTPPYMAPEQYQGGATDAASDQFAFCAALHEALYGTRPFAGDSPAQIAERALRGELARPERDRGVPSAIAAAVRRGLAARPEDRFASLGALLDALAVRRRSRAPWLAAGGAVAVAVAAIASVLAVRGTTAPPVGLIAVEPIRLATPSNPAPPEWSDALGDVLALLLGDIAGTQAVGPTYLLGADALREARGRPLTAAAWRAAEAKAGAAYVVHAAIEERGDRLHASLALVAGARTTTVDVERPRDELAVLLDAATDALARAVGSHHALARGHASNRARALFAIGNDHLRDGDYQVARPFLEQAIAADPSHFDAWYALALVRSWVLAPNAQVIAAADAALATAPTPAKRQLVTGIGHFLRHELSAAQTALAALARDADLSALERRDALYMLGEAHWHDGHHKVGVGFLQQALDLDLRFRLPAQHLAEYAIANRDQGMMRQYAALFAFSGSELRGATDFVAGDYEDQMRSGSSPSQLYAALVLGRTPSPDMEAPVERYDLDRHTYRAARALGAGDAAAAGAELDAIWQIVRARKAAGELTDATYFSLGLIGDAVITADAAIEARRLVEFLADRSRERPVRGYQRLSILAAPLVGDRTWIVRRDLTDRERRLADAIDAEMTGDRVRAAALLREIVGDPSPSWDYPERMALLRDLRALGRTSEARALCGDTMRPAIFQWAFLPARRACDRVQAPVAPSR